MTLCEELSRRAFLKRLVLKYGRGIFEEASEETIRSGFLTKDGAFCCFSEIVLDEAV